MPRNKPSRPPQIGLDGWEVPEVYVIPDKYREHFGGEVDTRKLTDNQRQSLRAMIRDAELQIGDRVRWNGVLWTVDDMESGEVRLALEIETGKEIVEKFVWIHKNKLRNERTPTG